MFRDLRTMALLELLNELEPGLIERLARTPSRHDAANTGAANRDARSCVSHSVNPTSNFVLIKLYLA